MLLEKKVENKVFNFQYVIVKIKISEQIASNKEEMKRLCVDIKEKYNNMVHTSTNKLHINSFTFFRSGDELKCFIWINPQVTKRKGAIEAILGDISDRYKCQIETHCANRTQFLKEIVEQLCESEILQEISSKKFHSASQ